MKFSKFKIISLLLVVSMVFGFAGCQSAPEEEGLVPPEITASAPVYEVNEIVNNGEVIYDNNNFSEFKAFYNSEFKSLTDENFLFFDVTGCFPKGADPIYGRDGFSTVYVERDKTDSKIQRSFMTQEAYILARELVVEPEYATEDEPIPYNVGVNFYMFMAPIERSVIKEDILNNLRYEYGLTENGYENYVNIYYEDTCFSTVYFFTYNSGLVITANFVENFIESHLLTEV